MATNRRRSSIIIAPKDLKPDTELYFESMSKPLGVTGEVKKDERGNLMVDQCAFFAHLLKIALTWSIGHSDGLKAFPTVLREICETDIPALRSVIANLNGVTGQMLRDESLILASQYRHDRIFKDQRLNDVLRNFQRPLIGLFMSLVGRNP